MRLKTEKKNKNTECEIYKLLDNFAVGILAEKLANLLTYLYLLGRCILTANWKLEFLLRFQYYSSKQSFGRETGFQTKIKPSPEQQSKKHRQNAIISREIEKVSKMAYFTRLPTVGGLR